jgi:hypothetical protein
MGRFRTWKIRISGPGKTTIVFRVFKSEFGVIQSRPGEYSGIWISVAVLSRNGLLRLI